MSVYRIHSTFYTEYMLTVFLGNQVKIDHLFSLSGALYVINLHYLLQSCVFLIPDFYKGGLQSWKGWGKNWINSPPSSCSMILSATKKSKSDDWFKIILLVISPCNMWKCKVAKVGTFHPFFHHVAPPWLADSYWPVQRNEAGRNQIKAFHFTLNPLLDSHNLPFPHL